MMHLEILQNHPKPPHDKFCVLDFTACQLRREASQTLVLWTATETDGDQKFGRCYKKGKTIMTFSITRRTHPLPSNGTFFMNGNWNRNWWWLDYAADFMRVVCRTIKRATPHANVTILLQTKRAGRRREKPALKMYWCWLSYIRFVCCEEG